MSRDSGDFFEYQVTQWLLDNYEIKLDNQATCVKYNKWKAKYKYVPIALPTIPEFDNYDKLRLCADKEGCDGNNADIMLSGDNALLPISLKNNNFSIKHPRCNAIHKHLVPSLQDKYISAYKELNDKYYKLARKKGYETFDAFLPEEKKEMYIDFRFLLYDMCSKSRKTCINIFMFCIGVHNKNQLTITKKNNTITVRKYKKLDMQKIKVKLISYTSFYLKVGDVCLIFRIHSASKKITPTLSLKYDVKPENINALFEEI